MSLILAVGGADGSAELVGAKSEINRIATHFSKPTILTGAKANETEVNQFVESGKIKEFTNIHFASHGVGVQSDPLLSRLVLAPSPQPDKLNPVDNAITARQVMRTWRLDADLVFLSACNTARGRPIYSEGNIGFSQAYLVAGARNVVLTRWEIDDRSTQLVVEKFYQSLADNKDSIRPISKAMCKAQRWLQTSDSFLASDRALAVRASPVRRSPVGSGKNKSRKTLSPPTDILTIGRASLTSVQTRMDLEPRAVNLATCCPPLERFSYVGHGYQYTCRGWRLVRSSVGFCVPTLRPPSSRL